MPIEEMTRFEKIQVFEDIAIPYMSPMYRTALRLTRNEKDAEDLLQEAFLRAYKSFHQFQLGTNIKAWLFKILTNLHINRYQKQARRPNSVSYDDLEEFYLYNQLLQKDIFLNTNNIEEELLNNLFDTEVKEAIEKLPWEFRITVLLADIEGFRYQEIADILNCPIGTVRSRLSRGRRLLEKYLWEYFDRNYNNKLGERRNATQ
jgi:RNA polymerase sigma-70 factor (ECF subfamily)